MLLPYLETFDYLPCRDQNPHSWTQDPLCLGLLATHVLSSPYTTLQPHHSSHCVSNSLCLTKAVAFFHAFTLPEMLYSPTHSLPISLFLLLSFTCSNCSSSVSFPSWSRFLCILPTPCSYPFWVLGHIVLKLCVHVFSYFFFFVCLA